MKEFSAWLEAFGGMLKKNRDEADDLVKKVSEIDFRGVNEKGVSMLVYFCWNDDNNNNEEKKNNDEKKMTELFLKAYLGLKLSIKKKMIKLKIKKMKRKEMIHKL